MLLHARIDHSITSTKALRNGKVKTRCFTRESARELGFSGFKRPPYRFVLSDSASGNPLGCCEDAGGPLEHHLSLCSTLVRGSFLLLHARIDHRLLDCSAGAVSGVRLPTEQNFLVALV